MRLNSIQVHSHPIQVSRFVSHLHPGSEIHVSSSSQLSLTSIQVIIFASRLHPGQPNCILAPSKHHLRCIHVSRCVSHLYPDHFSTGDLYLSSIPVPYHPVLVSRCASQLNPGPISTPSRSRYLCLLSNQAPRFVFLLCLSWISPQSGSWYLHLTYIQVTSHQHPGQPNCILVPSNHHLKPIQVSRCMPSQPDSQNCIWDPSISNLCRFQDVRLNSTQTLLNLNQDFNILASPLSMYHLTFFQVQCRGAKSSVDDLGPYIYISHTAWCRYSCLTSIRAVSPPSSSEML